MKRALRFGEADADGDRRPRNLDRRIGRGACRATTSGEAARERDMRSAAQVRFIRSPSVVDNCFGVPKGSWAHLRFGSRPMTFERCPTGSVDAAPYRVVSESSPGCVDVSSHRQTRRRAYASPDVTSIACTCVERSSMYPRAWRNASCHARRHPAHDRDHCHASTQLANGLGELRRAPVAPIRPRTRRDTRARSAARDRVAPIVTIISGQLPREAHGRHVRRDDERRLGDRGDVLRADTPGATSLSSRPSDVGSSTASSVTTRLTGRVEVSGSVHLLRIFGLPFAVCSMATITRRAP